MLSRLSIFVFVAIVSLALVACTKSSQSEVATECSATVTCPSGNVCVNNVCVKLNSGSDSTSGDDSNTTTDTTAPNDTNETGDTSADGGSEDTSHSDTSLPDASLPPDTLYDAQPTDSSTTDTDVGLDILADGSTVPDMLADDATVGSDTLIVGDTELDGESDAELDVTPTFVPDCGTAPDYQSDVFAPWVKCTQGCKYDTDCARVQLGCCSCSSNGAPLPINGGYAKLYNKIRNLACGATPICSPSYICDDCVWTAPLVCDKGTCSVKCL